MKQFVIFVILSAFILQGDAKKVCILFEQKNVTAATILNDQESVTINEEIVEAQNDIVITLGEISEVTDEISTISLETLADEVVTEGVVTEKVDETPDVSDAITILLNDTDSKQTNICALEGITLFDDQNDLLRRLCAIKPDSSSLYVITVQNSVVKTDLSLAALCTEGPKGLLSWISWQDFIEKVRPLLSADELPQLVVRNSSIGDVDPFSEVLIEMLPIRYRLENVKPSAWNNNTFIRTVSLGSISLENSKDSEQHIEGELNYSFPVETNITFLSSYPIKGVPLEMTDERKNFIVGSGTTYLFNSSYSVERLVPALKTEIVSLKGTFGLHEYDIDGKIISIFGENADGSIIEESHTISARVVSLETFDIKDTYSLEDSTSTTTEEIKVTTIEELPIPIPFIHAPLYPGFRKFFYVAVFLIFSLLLVVLVDITRLLRKDRIAKSQGNRSYQKIDPKF